MITQNEINRLYEWASNTSFPLRNERITSKYMGYGMMISHIKIGKKFKKYPNKQISKPVRDIVEKEDILGIYYVYYPPKMIAKPHVDYNPYQKDYLRFQSLKEEANKRRFTGNRMISVIYLLFNLPLITTNFLIKVNRYSQYHKVLSEIEVMQEEIDKYEENPKINQQWSNNAKD